MMQYVVKKTFTAPLEHIDVEYEQRNLFELSVGKLQQEQLRHGVEPRLLRFVLINNALRALQCHMMKVEEPPLTLSESNVHEEDTESFLCNTFKDGGLSLSPQSPPTPIKVRTLGSLLSDLSPLVSSTGIPEESSLPDEGSACSTTEFGKLVESIGRVADIGSEGGEAREGGGAGENGEDKSYPVYGERLGKHAMSDPIDDSTPEPKKVCTDCLEGQTDKDEMKSLVKDKVSVPPLINGSVLPTTNGVYGSLDLITPLQSTLVSPSSDTDSEDESSTLSPIDFTKVDPSLYDYDLSGGHDPTSSLTSTTPSSTPLFSAPVTTPHISLATTTPPVTMTTAQPSSCTSSPCAPPVSLPLISTSSATPPSKSAQTESVLSNDSSRTDSPIEDATCKNSKFSGSMEGVVSTQNGHLDETDTLANSNKLCGCSPEGTTENDFFEDLVSLLIT